MSDIQMTAAFAAPDPADLAPLFPGYEIEALIATGGMGAVYRAVQKSLERPVAIKILPHEFSNDAAFCAGFEAEAKAMARLNHPNLIGVYDFGEVAGMLYIIMEYVPGQSLFHSAHGIAIDPAEVIRLVTGICNGLAHAHENGIIHRDIKPSNILLDLSANPKIGDFGLARPVDRQVQEGEEIFGTPHYTAPEVVNSPESVDHRADIFSVGVILHELLTGRLPAEDDRPASAIASCDPRFDAIIRRATAQLPDQRYSSALEIGHELHSIATSAGAKVLRAASPNAPAPLRPGQRKGESVRRPKKSSGAPFVFILLIAVAIAAFAYKYLADQKAARETASKTPTAPASELPAENPPPAEPEPTPLPDDGTLVESPQPPAPEPVPQIQTPSAPAPEPKISPEPKFDVTGFLGRARNIMRDRSAPLIQTRDLNLAKNLEAFERALRRVARNIALKSGRENFEDSLERFINACEQSGNRIPQRMIPSLIVFPKVEGIHAEFLGKQEAIDSSLPGEFSQLSSTYTLGIQKQIERLKADDDPAAIELLEEEIESVREDESYFTELMLDHDAGPQDP